MRNGEPVILLHIRDALTRILEYVEDGEREFMRDARTQDAVLRRLEIVGEAVKRLPDGFETSTHTSRGSESPRFATLQSTITIAWT